MTGGTTRRYKDGDLLSVVQRRKALDTGKEKVRIVEEIYLPGMVCDRGSRRARHRRPASPRPSHDSAGDCRYRMPIWSLISGCLSSICQPTAIVASMPCAPPDREDRARSA